MPKLFNCHIGYVLIIIFVILNLNLICQVKNSKNSNQLIEKYKNLGKQNYRKSNYIEALNNFNSALNIAEEIGDSAQIAKLSSNIGVIHDMFGNYDKALEQYHKSLHFYSQIQNQHGREAVLNNLGILYEEMERPEDALKNYFTALGIKLEKNDFNGIANTLNNIAIVYENFLKKTDSAVYFYNEALSYYQKNNNKKGIGLIKSNLGLIQLRKGNIDEAGILIDQSYELFKVAGDSVKLANVLFYKGKIYSNNNDYENALNYYYRALLIAEKAQIKKLQRNIYNELSECYIKTKEFEKAVVYLKKHNEVNHEIINKEKLSNIVKLETIVKYQNNEERINKLKIQSEKKHQDSQRMRAMLIFIIVLLIFILIIAILSRRNVLLRKNQELLILQSQLFRSQTSPHFIFNALMSIQTFLMDRDINTASKYLVKFAKLIRSILQNTQKSLISLDNEIEILKNYLSLEELRFGDKFIIDFRVDVENAEEIQFPPMLTQPFIENAIVHGLTPSPKKGKLQVFFKEQNNILTITIEDNGIGRKMASLKQKSSEHKSMAIDISKKRIGLVSKRFKKKINFEIIDLKDKQNNAVGTRVVFRMPIV